MKINQFQKRSEALRGDELATLPTVFVGEGDAPSQEKLNEHMLAGEKWHVSQFSEELLKLESVYRYSYGMAIKPQLPLIPVVCEASFSAKFSHPHVIRFNSDEYALQCITKWISRFRRREPKVILVLSTGEIREFKIEKPKTVEEILKIELPSVFGVAEKEEADLFTKEEVSMADLEDLSEEDVLTFSDKGDDELPSDDELDLIANYHRKTKK